MGNIANARLEGTSTDIYLPRLMPISYKSSTPEMQARLDAVALELAKHRARTGLIRQLAGWGTVRARELYQTVTGSRPPSGGGLSTSIGLIRQDPRIHVHATLFSTSYLAVLHANEQEDRLAGENFLTAYAIYRSQASTAEQAAEPVQLHKNSDRKSKRRRRNIARQSYLTINDAALVLSDLSSQVAYLTPCNLCRVHYLRPTEELIGQILDQQASISIRDIHRITSCPLCQLRAKWSCRRCGATLKTPGTRCSHCPPE